jgi:hypothetical protein
MYLPVFSITTIASSSVKHVIGGWWWHISLRTFLALANQPRTRAESSWVRTGSLRDAQRFRHSAEHLAGDGRIEIDIFTYSASSGATKAASRRLEVSMRQSSRSPREWHCLLILILGAGGSGSWWWWSRARCSAACARREVTKQHPIFLWPRWVERRATKHAVAEGLTVAIVDRKHVLMILSML